MTRLDKIKSRKKMSYIRTRVYMVGQPIRWHGMSNTFRYMGASKSCYDQITLFKV